MKKYLTIIYILLFFIGNLNAEKIYIEYPNGDGFWGDKTESWYEYDLKGNKIHYKDTDGNEEWWSYNSMNLVTQYKNNKGYSELSAYNKNGLLTYKKTVNENNEEIEQKYEYDMKSNMIHYQEYPSMIEYYCIYDEKGRLIEKENRYGTNIYKLIEEFDDKGNLIHYKDEVNEEWYEYNSENKIILYKNSDEEIHYDNKGDLIYKKEYSKGGLIGTWYQEYWYENGKQIHWKNTLGTEIWTDYSNNGKSAHSKRNDGYEFWETFDENGNPLSYKTSDGVVYIHKYDSNGNKIYDEYNFGPTQSIYKYDEQGNEIYTKTISMIEDFECWKKYDSDNNLINAKCNNGYEEWYEYDSNKNEISYKDSLGSERKYNEKGYLIYECEIEPDF